MTNRVALITGCGKRIGIGAAVARALAAAGVTVVVSDIEAKGVANQGGVHATKSDETDPSWRGLESLVVEITASGGTVSSTLGNVTLEGDAKHMVAEVLNRYGRLDILVNNAGAPHGDDRNEIEDIPIAAWNRMMAINTFGPFLMSRAAVIPMRAQKWGRIINISSSLALSPRRKQRVVYSTSKAAIIGFTKSLAIDLATVGITVNAVSLGAIKTSRALYTASHLAAGDVDAGLAAVAKNIPLGRLGSPEEAAAMVVFLASEASSYITGQVIGVNGGSAGSA